VKLKRGHNLFRLCPLEIPVSTPYAGITQIRFKGYFLSLRVYRNKPIGAPLNLYLIFTPSTPVFENNQVKIKVVFFVPEPP